MKSNLPKIFILAVISILIFPQVSFAAWWNPFTWKIFSRTPTEKVQETKQPSEIEKLRSEVEELKKKVATPATSAVKPSVVISDKSKATAKPVIPVAKPVVTVPIAAKPESPQKDQKDYVSLPISFLDSAIRNYTSSKDFAESSILLVEDAVRSTKEMEAMYRGARDYELQHTPNAPTNILGGLQYMMNSSNGLTMIFNIIKEL